MKTYLFLLLGVVALAALGCDPLESSTNNTNNTSNNVNNVNNTTTNNVNNVNNTNNVNNIGPGTCDVSDLPRQLECNPGYKCTITNPSGDIGCVNNGPLGVGDACVPVTASQNQDGCPVYTVCVPTEGTSMGVCRSYCEMLYFDCAEEGQFCFTEAAVDGGTAKVCDSVDTCDPYWNPPAGYDGRTGCASDEYCYGFLGGTLLTKCVSETDPVKEIGTGMKGAPCSNSLDCAPGHVCFGGSTESTCHYICQTQDDCGLDYCTPISDGDDFGLCM